MLAGLVVVVALPPGNEGLFGGTAPLELDDAVPLPAELLAAELPAEPAGAVLSVAPPLGVAVELTGALVCEPRWVDTGSAGSAGSAADVVARAAGLAALVDAAAEVWAASIDADALDAAPNTGLPSPEADEVIAGWPCPATADEPIEPVGPGTSAHTITAHSPTPTPAPSGSASRPRSGSGAPASLAGSIALVDRGGIGPVVRRAPGCAR